MQGRFPVSPILDKGRLLQIILHLQREFPRVVQLTFGKFHSIERTLRRTVPLKKETKKCM